ncbi:LacI family DNA-binding transcriptional regulator [Bartonella sp. HY761]|uniref:LacI family DNA-binding transcriptional regulator n=1 Tax=Bartonella sp. HY761 TaxID=2979330 RepID=UPI0021FBC98B|nr:LacI family DNA-binding transcriptional regulator [Bartonella sp. HY761]UXN05629.1 LacI family transcriptional regulator [Bartonella sp. HY761]
MVKSCSKTISIKDVAKAAGVSTATVSRTLANGKVSDDMREKVETAILKTGYRPNLAARRLRSRQNKTIGLIVADIRNPFFTSIARFIEKAVEKEGFRIILCNTDENTEREKEHLSQMIEERVAGVILASTPEGLSNLDNWPSSIPLVLIDRTLPHAKFDQVKIDNENASHEMIRHMVKNGRKKILCLYSENSITGLARKNGYEMAIQEMGLAASSQAIAHGSSLSQIAAIFKNITDIDGVFISNGVLALRVCTALLQAKISIPQQLSVATFDDEPWAALIAGGLSVIDQPKEAIAQQAVRLLFQRMEKPEIDPELVVLAGQPIFRNSTQNY